MEWKEEQELKLSEPEPVEGEERKMRKAYERYKKVVALGMGGASVGGIPAKSIERQIAAGFGTARMMTWRSLAILPEVYKNQYGHPPSKIEVSKLIQGTKPLILSIAQSNIRVLGAVQNDLVGVFDPEGKERNASQDDFISTKFAISQQGNNMYLEIKPEVLEEIKFFLEKFSSTDVVYTGCPAIFAQGAQGKNVVAEMYDWLAKLYKKLYIDTQTQFK